MLNQYQRQCSHIASQLEHLRFKMAQASEAADRALGGAETGSTSSGGDYGFSQLRPLPGISNLNCILYHLLNSPIFSPCACGSTRTTSELDLQSL